ncbi:MAG: 7TM diverse intracellular signaling domain-containing protein [Ferruginibacter sp.]
MTQLLFIEIFVLGASLIASIYHFVLFVQQKDKFLLFYSIYLFSASLYIIFKLLSNNYDPFEPTTNTWKYSLEEILQVIMYSSYATFAAVTLEVTNKPPVIKWCWIGLLIFSGLAIVFHIYKATFFGPGITTRANYAISRLTTIFVAGFALLLAWRVRTSVFQKTIIIGSYVYAFFAMFSVFSFIFNKSYFGLSGVEPYLIGSFIDIIIFSGALGYRFKKIAEEKNRLLHLSLQTAESRTNIARSLNDDVGAALSSIHVYASVAESMVNNDLQKTAEYIQQIKLSSLGIMDDVSDIIWALNLTPAAIAEALPLRIKQCGLELFTPLDITCAYELDETAIQHITDVAGAKKVLQQVKEGMKNIAAAGSRKSVTVFIKLMFNGVNVKVA